MADGLVDQYGLILPFLAESKPTVFDCAPSRWLGVRLWRGVSPYIASHHTVREIEPRPTGPGHRAQCVSATSGIQFERFSWMSLNSTTIPLS